MDRCNVIAKYKLKYDQASSLIKELFFHLLDLCCQIIVITTTTATTYHLFQIVTKFMYFS